MPTDVELEYNRIELRKWCATAALDFCKGDGDVYSTLDVLLLAKGLANFVELGVVVRDDDEDEDEEDEDEKKAA